jgi:hypothetical protein
MTPEEIADATEDLYGLSNIKAINKIFRQEDESHLWPICGQFNATERAIRNVREYAKHNGAIYGLEYCCMLDAEISRIVNEQHQ